MTSLEIVRTIEAELSRRGISKGQFYKDCDVSSATFSQWRTGTYYPSLTALPGFAARYGTSPHHGMMDNSTSSSNAVLRSEHNSRA